MTRAKRSCRVKAEEQQIKHFPNPPDTAATDEDRAKWQGFCEIESEPAIFNAILSKWGVEGIKTQEVMYLDSDTLKHLPQPVNGIIFLFRYHDLDAGPEEDEASSAAENVWFATQNMDNMCGTLALLNMVMNIEDVQLGSLLTRFKDSTKSMRPVERGDSVADFTFVRQVHNSWAKKTDMLNQDLGLQDTFRKAKRRKTAARSRKKQKEQEQEEEAAFHFVTYVPVRGQIWKLDGMNERPQLLPHNGDANKGWLQQVVDVLSDRMAMLIGEQIQFNILAMTKDPLLSARERLAENDDAVLSLERRLNDLEPHWKLASSKVAHSAIRSREKCESDGDEGEEQADPAAPMCNGILTGDEHQGTSDAQCNGDSIDGVCNGVGTNGTAVETAQSESTGRNGNIEASQKDPDLLALFQQHESLVNDRVKLHKAYEEEEREQKTQAARAEARTWEYGPLVGKWLRFLAQNDDAETGRSTLEKLIDEMD